MRKPELDSRLLNTGHRVISKWVSSTLIPEHGGDPGFDVVKDRFDASSEIHLRSSLQSIHDVINVTPFNRNVHHHGF